MKFTQNILIVAALGTTSQAFSLAPQGARMAQPRVSHPARNLVALPMSTSSTEEEVERLRNMAAKLREEVASLEQEKQESMAALAQKAFAKFDLNKDGEISIEELKAGLEKTFKLEGLPEDRVQNLMETFDKSGDGKLQPDEFVGVDQLRNRLEALEREERALAKREAQMAKAEEAVAKAIDEQMALINDRAPTTKEKVVSVLPYLLPLVDSLQYAGSWIAAHPDNIFAATGALLFTLYHSIPFAGFLAFIGLSFFSGNLEFNRLVRFNMQQAIALDIALFFPSLIAFVVGLTGVTAPPEALDIAGNGIFLTMLAAIGYSSVSSLLGQTPDKIPFISDSVNRRVPSAEDIKMNNELFFRGAGVDFAKLQEKLKEKKESEEEEK